MYVLTIKRGDYMTTKENYKVDSVSSVSFSRVFDAIKELESRLKVSKLRGFTLMVDKQAYKYLEKTTKRGLSEITETIELSLQEWKN